MNDMNVKVALNTLASDDRLTQRQIATALGCTQKNVHYHMHRTAVCPRTSPVALAAGARKLIKKHKIVLPHADAGVV